MSNDKPKQKPLVFNKDFKPSNQDHGEGESCGRHVRYRPLHGAPLIFKPLLSNDNIQAPLTNKGVLKSIFSKVSGGIGDFLDTHRKKILLGTATACTVAETLVTQSAPVFSLPFLIAGGVLSHDASEDVLEQIGKLKDSQGLSAGVVGTAIGFGHTLAEGAFSVMASVNQSTDMAIASVMGSQPSHILLMAGGAAVIGTLGAGKPAAWKLHAGAMGLLSGAFGVQVAAGEFYPAAGAAMIAGGGYYLYRRVQEGQGCAIHGSGCSGHTHSHDHGQTEKTPMTLKQRITDPHLLSLGGSVITLTTAAHLMAHEFITLSHMLGVSETTMGATIAAISLAAPEIILTWKAAHKGQKELAWGTIVGCSTATVGLVGGGLALSGAPVPEMLDPTTTQGLIHILGFGGSTAAVLITTHPSINKDGKLGKVIGTGFLAAYMTYLAASGGVPSGHYHTMPDGTKIYHSAQDENPSQIDPKELKDLPVLDLTN